MPPELFVNFNKQLRWRKTDKMKSYEFVDWGKIPFTTEEAITGILRVAQETDKRMCSGDLSDEDEIQLHSNALDVIGMIFGCCGEDDIIIENLFDEFNENIILKDLWKTLRDQFGSLKVTVQNREPPYLV